MTSFSNKQMKNFERERTKSWYQNEFSTNAVKTGKKERVVFTTIWVINYLPVFSHPSKPEGIPDVS